MKNRWLWAVVVVAGLTGLVPLAWASPEGGPVEAVVEKFAKAVDGAEDKLDDYADALEAAHREAPGAVCANEEAIRGKLSEKAHKLYIKVHKALGKALAKLEKLAEGGADPSRIQAARFALGSLWQRHFTNEGRFWSEVQDVFDECD
jgi:hypothetical protein